MSPYNREFALCRIFSTTTGWSYPSSWRALPSQQPSLLHNTASSWLDFGGNQTIHPLQISPLLKEGVRWFVWARMGSKPAAACCLWLVDGMADHLMINPRKEMKTNSFEPSFKGLFNIWEAFRIDSKSILMLRSRQQDSTSSSALLCKAESGGFCPTDETLTTNLPIQEPKTATPLVIGQSGWQSASWARAVAFVVRLGESRSRPFRPTQPHCWRGHNCRKVGFRNWMKQSTRYEIGYLFSEHKYKPI